MNKPSRMGYAPVSNVRLVLDSIRDGTLVTPVTSLTLNRLGIPTGNVPRTVLTIKFLGLVDENGNSTDRFRRMYQSSEEQFDSIIMEMIKDSYSEVLQRVDPTTASEEEIISAFTKYEPESQQPKMVTLFIGLCVLVGIRKDYKRAFTQRTQPRLNTEVLNSTTLVLETPGDSTSYQPLYVMMNHLPKQGRWHKRQRDLWVEAFTATLDYLIETEQ